MPNLGNLKKSNFLKKGDVEPPLLITVSGFEEQNVAMEDKPEDMKWVLWFNELDKPLVLNQTNGTIMSHIAKSEEFSDWVGKEVEIYFDPTVMFGGEMKGGIRLRPPYAPPPPAQRPAQAARPATRPAQGARPAAPQAPRPAAPARPQAARPTTASLAPRAASIVAPAPIGGNDPLHLDGYTDNGDGTYTDADGNVFNPPF